MNKRLAERMDEIPFSGIRTVFEKAKKLESEGKSIIHLTLGRPDFDTPDHIKQAAITALNNGEVHYTSNYGTDGLREAIVEKLRVDNAIEVDKSEVIVTVGANEAVLLAIAALVNEGEEILVPDPIWAHYIHCATMLGVKSVSYRLNEDNLFQPDMKELGEKISDKTKVLVINTPHNPTGAVLNKETLEKLASFAKKHQLMIISDEIYEKLIYDNEEHISIASLPGMKERTVTINGFSKLYSMTGWRIGYLAAPKWMISGMVRIHQYTVTCATAFAQFGAEAALRSSQACVEEMRTAFNERRKQLVKRIDAIEELSVIEPKGAFYVFVNIKKLEMSSEQFTSWILKEAGVATIPGTAFGENGEGYIRMAYSSSLKDIHNAMDRIEKLLKENRETVRDC